MKLPIALIPAIWTLAWLLTGQPALAQQSVAPQSAAATVSDPLLRVLAAKGLITQEEALTIGAADTPAAQRQRLALLLRGKGILTDAEVASILGTDAPAKTSEPVLLASTSPLSVALPMSVQQPKPAAAAQPAAPAAPAAPAVIPAVAPLRVMPIDPVKREGIIPDLKLGSGARLKPYGFVKASMIYDTSSPSGTDMPLSYLNGDTGPTVDPEFHIRARNMRLGSQFEWLDVSPKIAITGRFEADFEGNFSRALNRNISTIRSSMFSLRTAWGRIDYMKTDKTDLFVLIGQDWTPFGSSTLPNLVETTGLGLGFGTLYERAPLAKVGLVRTIGGKRNVKFSPEFAIVMPAFGNTPANVADQLAYGERQGADSGRPEVQGRIVTQWQLDTAPGVAPAQFIVSGTQARRAALVRTADVPAAYKAAFPNGAEVDSSRYGYTVELQLPTRNFTWTGKYFAGKDLRFYFVGGLYSNFNDTYGLTGVATAPSIDGASTVAFGNLNGVPTIAPERAVRVLGYNTDLSFPLSRIFKANPAGHNAGWTTNFHYGIDMTPAREARRLSGVRAKDDMASWTLNWKFSALATLQFEEGMYRTRAANHSPTDQGGLFLLRGIPARNWHDYRTELGILFAF